METIEPKTKEEALAAITHASRLWNIKDVNDEFLEEKRIKYLDQYYKYAKKLGATETDMLRATLLGTPDKNEQQGFLNTYFDDVMHHGSEQLLAELPSIINIKNEFGLEDPTKIYRSGE